MYLPRLTGGLSPLCSAARQVPTVNAPCAASEIAALPHLSFRHPHFDYPMPTTRSHNDDEPPSSAGLADCGSSQHLQGDGTSMDGRGSINNGITSSISRRPSAAAAASAGDGGGGHGDGKSDGNGDADHHLQHSELPLTRSRIAKACDGCKARKVKCDGRQPCSYCIRRQRSHQCRYSPHRRRRQSANPQHVSASTSDTSVVTTSGPGLASISLPASASIPPPSPPPHSSTPRSTSRALSLGHDRERAWTVGHGRERGHGHEHGQSRSSPASRDNAPPPPAATPSVAALRQQTSRQAAVMDASAEDDTDVPREARLLRDAQGKLAFIGDCAPLSLFQSIRQFVTSRIGHTAFAPETSRFSVLENAPLGLSDGLASSHRALPDVLATDVAPAVAEYLTVTSGLVDLFDHLRLADDILLWASVSSSADQRSNKPSSSLDSILYYLVIAIGRRHEDGDVALAYFEHARDQAYQSLNHNLSVETIQAFVLITVYMLLSCQINSAFLVFGIAVRAAYSIGLHRTEVNARFSQDIHRQRDRLWKSLRVVDLFMSVSMGRPPATADVDCTVPYRALDNDGIELFDLLNASVQILLLLEVIVTQIYSRKKISLQLTEGISLQLREWSAQWLWRLKDIIAQPDAHTSAELSGASQILSSYYYSVMLVSRPFLMYELFRRLSDSSAGGIRASTMASGKSRLADACIDAASIMVDSLQGLIEQRSLNGQMPLLVSWLFASSLVLGVGLLGGFGRILEKYTRMSIRALDYFAQYNTHATQYSLIAQSLLTTALEYLEKRELQERMRRTESSSQLFGLLPHDVRQGATASPMHHRDSQSQAAAAVASTVASMSSPVARRSDLMVDSFHSQGSTSAAAAAAAAASVAQQQQHQHHHQQQQQHQQATAAAAAAHVHTHSPQLGDLDGAFFGLGDSLMATPETNFWSTYQGYGHDPGTALNLFPLLDSGGGIDLAHYF